MAGFSAKRMLCQVIALFNFWKDLKYPINLWSSVPWLCLPVISSLFCCFLRQFPVIIGDDLFCLVMFLNVRQDLLQGFCCFHVLLPVKCAVGKLFCRFGIVVTVQMIKQQSRTIFPWRAGLRCICFAAAFSSAFIWYLINDKLPVHACGQWGNKISNSGH